MRIKICGITRIEDALTAADAGADAIGLVFAPSPRQITLPVAREITAALPPFITAVGVFVNARPLTILRTVEKAGLGAVQLHGDESPAFAKKLGAIPTIKAIRVRDADFTDDIRAFTRAGCNAILLDTYTKKARGGTGKRIDLRLIQQARDNGAFNDTRIILAGGLTPANATRAIRCAAPWAVDVSGGVETRPGIKSPAKIRRFIENARRAAE